MRKALFCSKTVFDLAEDYWDQSTLLEDKLNELAGARSFLE